MTAFRAKNPTFHLMGIHTGGPTTRKRLNKMFRVEPLNTSTLQKYCIRDLVSVGFNGIFQGVLRTYHTPKTKVVTMMPAFRFSHFFPTMSTPPPVTHPADLHRAEQYAANFFAKDGIVVGLKRQERGRAPSCTFYRGYDFLLVKLR